jgi:hypothetical protein
MKHVGKMKNNAARVAVAYRTIPGDHNSALVIGTSGLTDAYHDALMSLIEGDAGQQANELADILAVRRFPDGTVMLQFLHSHGHLKKVPTNLVLMTPNSQTSIPLDEVNQMIASQKGVKVEDLAVSDGNKKPEVVAVKEEIISAQEIFVPDEPVNPLATAKTYRSKADTLAKEAANFRRMADALDPPKKKVKAEA